jgi:lipopolysaccharide export system protein LptC
MSYRSINLASGSRALHQVVRNSGDQVFRAAARHSRMVRILRYAVPASMVAIAFIVLAASFLNRFRLVPAFPIDPGKISLSGTKINMELPRFNGFTTDSRPYQLIARVAVQDVTKPDILELEEIEAQIDLKDGQHVNVRSINGIYDTRREVLQLSNHIVVNSSSGYEGHLSEATISVATGDVVSESPVEMKLPNDGLLNANRLESGQNGDLIVFGGGVEVTLNPERRRAAPQEEQSSSGSAQSARGAHP